MNARVGNSLDWHLLAQAREVLSAGATTTAIQLSQHALHQGQRHKDGSLIANSLRTLTHAHLLQGQFARADECAGRAVQAFLALTDPAGHCDTLALQCYANSFLGRDELALASGETAASLSLSTRSVLHQSTALSALGLATAWAMGESTSDDLLTASVWTAEQSEFEFAPFTPLAISCFTRAMQCLRDWHPAGALPDLSKLALVVRKSNRYAHAHEVSPLHGGTKDILDLFYEFGRFTLTLLVGHTVRAESYLANCELIVARARNPPWLPAMAAWARACLQWARRQTDAAALSAATMAQLARHTYHHQLEKLALDLQVRLTSYLH